MNKTKLEGIMANYIDLPISELELDKKNPRIAELLERYNEDDITPEILSLALGAAEETYDSLKESIRENGGVINPILVNKCGNKYLVIEGNTRVQIYRKFVTDNIKGDWTKIKSIVYEELDPATVHSIRLQAHLVGTRDWTPFAQAKYLYHLYHEEKMPMNQIVAFCGGKSNRVKDLIAAYDDVENYYRPICNDDSQLDQHNFSAFIELQKRNVLQSLAANKYSKEEFVKWVQDDKFSRLEHIRRLPDIFKSPEAKKVFLRENSENALKILAVEEYSSKELKDVPYEDLAYALAERLREMKHVEVINLRDDIQFEDKLNSLQQVSDALEFIFEEINRNS